MTSPADRYVYFLMYRCTAVLQAVFPPIVERRAEVAYSRTTAAALVASSAPVAAAPLPPSASVRYGGGGRLSDGEDAAEGGGGSDGAELAGPTGSGGAPPVGPTGGSAFAFSPGAADFGDDDGDSKYVHTFTPQGYFIPTLHRVL